MKGQIPSCRHRRRATPGSETKNWRFEGVSGGPKGRLRPPSIYHRLAETAGAPVLLFCDCEQRRPSFACVLKTPTCGGAIPLGATAFVRSIRGGPTERNWPVIRSIIKRLRILLLAAITVSQNWSVSTLVANPKLWTECAVGSIDTENETPPCGMQRR